MDVGSARVEVTGDVSRFASEVGRELSRILAGVRLPPVQVEGDFRSAESSAKDAAGNIEGDFQEGADKSEDALASVDGDFQNPQQSASQASEAIASDFESAGGRASAALGSATKFMVGAIVGVTAAATAAATAITAMSLARGFRRLADIEDAEAKLRGLGHEASAVDQIMSDAMEAVEGTILGFDEMAGVAASMVGAGIRPGRDLERTLKAIADASQIGGTGLAEMGDIIGQVAVAGRASMTEINRMQTRGIPILSWLAEQMGVTAEEARDMVSAGEVSFRDFRKAIEDNIGGAALEAAETTRGAWTNMVFTFTRTGAAMLSGVFPTFKEIFNGIAAVMAPVEQLANQIGPALGAAVEGFQSEGLRGAIDSFRASLDPEIFHSATSAIRDMVTSGLNYLSMSIGDMILHFLAAREDIFSAILGIIENIANALPEIIPRVVDAVVSMVTGIVTTLVNAAPMILEGAVALVTGLIEGILNSLPLVIDGAVSIVTTILTVLVQALPDLITAGVQILVGLITGIIGAIPQLVGAIVGIIPIIISTLIQIGPQLQMVGFELLLALVDGFIRALPGLMNSVRTDILPAFIEAIRTEFPAAIRQGTEFFQQFLVGIIESVEEISRVVNDEIVPAFIEMLDDNPEIIEAGVEMLMTLIQAWIDNLVMITQFITDTLIPMITTIIEQNLPELTDAGLKIMFALMIGMSQNSPEMIKLITHQILPAMVRAFLTAVPLMSRAAGQLIAGLVGSLWTSWRSTSARNLNRIRDAIANFFRNANQWLHRAGRDIIAGLINGLRSRFQDVQNTLGALTSRIPNWKGPAEVDRRILRDAGRHVMQGFQDGIQDERGKVESLLRSITQDMANQPRSLRPGQASDPSPMGEPTGGQGVRMWAAQRPDPILIQIRGDGTRRGELLVQELSDAVRVRGGNVQAVLGSGRGLG